MATEIHNHPEHHYHTDPDRNVNVNANDSGVFLWTALIVIAAIILGYLAYATYYGDNNAYNMPSTYNNSATDNTGNTTTTPAPKQDNTSPSSPNNVNP